MNTTERRNTDAASHALRMGFALTTKLIASNPNDPEAEYAFDPIANAWHEIDRETEHDRLCPTYSP